MSQRKKVYAKKPEKLTQFNADKLGINSNRAGYEASKKAIYFNHNPKIRDSLTADQKRRLESLRRTLKKQNV